jgi:L-asparaginase II
MAAPLTEITRGPLVESRHLGHVAIVDTSGSLVAWAGDPGTRLFFRSSAKPFQALPLLTGGAADALGFTSEELALTSASHNGSERHQAIVASMLTKAGLSENDLRCGIAPALDDEEKARIVLGIKIASQIQCECSGKHAGMLATCRYAGWPTEGYLNYDHPLQVEIRSMVAAACGVPLTLMDTATDGCSLPTFGAPLDTFAHAYAMLSDPLGSGWDVPSAWRHALLRLREAICLHPDLVSGDGEIDTCIMQLTGGKVVAKLGAEGLLCMAVPEHQVGVAISALDGSERGLGPAAVSALEHMQLIDNALLYRLRSALCPPVKTFTGMQVGDSRATLMLEYTAKAQRSRPVMAL